VSCAPYIRLACGRILPYASHYRTGLELLVVLGGIAVAGRLWCGADRFRQLNADKPNVHHDALELPNGETVLVTRLCEGQHATVLQLPASPHSVNAEVKLKPAPVVG